MKKVFDLLYKIVDPVLKISKGKVGNIAFYYAFSIVYLFRFYYSSMFVTLSEKPTIIAPAYYVGYIILLCLAGLAIVDAFYSSWKEAVILIGIFVVAAINAFVIGRIDTNFLLYCLILASRKRNIRPVFLLSVIIGSAFLLTAYFASMNGYIPYLVYPDRGNTGMLSHAFGMSYRTILAEHVLYIVMCYAIIRAEKLHLWEYMMLWFDNWLIWRYTWARTSCLCLTVFLIILGIVLIIYHYRGSWVKLPGWTALVHVSCVAVSLSAVALWSKLHSNVVIDTDTDSLRSRLSLSLQGFREYPLTLFGQIVRERGAGGIVDTSEPYFMLDILYVRLILMDGIVLFILYICLMSFASYKAAKRRHVILAAALMIVAVDSMVQHVASQFSYNVLILFSLGYLGSEKEELVSPLVSDSHENDIFYRFRKQE